MPLTGNAGLYVIVILLISPIIESLIVNDTVLECRNDRQTFSVNRTIHTLTYSIDETHYTFCELLVTTSNVLRDANVTISVNFSKTYSSCFNFVLIFDGSSIFDPLLAIYDGKNGQSVFSSSSNQILILYYKTRNSDELKISFAANKCLTDCSNHGSCIFNECVCDSDYSGFDCSIPKHCSTKNCNSPTPKYKDQFYSNLSKSRQTFSARAAHTASYVEAIDGLCVFGGYNYNTVLSNLQIYYFSNNSWTDIGDHNTLPNKNKTGTKLQKDYIKHILKQIENDEFSWWQSNSSQRFQFITEQIQDLINDTDTDTDTRTFFHGPQSRYYHAACSLYDSFVIFGGKLDNGSVTNDLWLFNVTTKQWLRKATISKLNPPAVMMHSLLCIDNQKIILFGGQNQWLESNSNIFSITLSEKPDNEQWTLIRPKNTLEHQIAVFGHSCVHYPATNSLIVIGGYTKLSHVNQRIFSFQFDYQIWTEINTKNNQLHNSVGVNIVSLHSANIIGDNLVIYGGVPFQSRPNFYLYNLKCNIWTNSAILENFMISFNHSVFSHASAVRFNSTLLIVGGISHNISNYFHAFTFPNSSHQYHYGFLCLQHTTSKSCLLNIECGWCSSDKKCFSKFSETNCSTNLESSKCYSLCETLDDCHSCTVYGSILSNISNNHCIWCSANSKCIPSSNFYEKCAFLNLLEMQNVSQIGECKQSQQRGLTLVQYNYPVDYLRPDKVSIVNSTKILLNLPMLYYDEVIKLMGKRIVFKILGNIYLPLASNTLKLVEACIDSYTLKLRLINELKNFYVERTILGQRKNFSRQTILRCTEPIYIHPGNDHISLEMKVEILINTNMHLQPVRVEFIDNTYRNRHTSQFLQSDYLEPYSHGDCNQYSNCLKCLIDSKCAWCPLNNKCFSRRDDEKDLCQAKYEADDDFWAYFIVEPKLCKTCSHFDSCESCVQMIDCEWKVIENRCQRIAYDSSISIRNEMFCPLNCNKISDKLLCQSNDMCVWYDVTDQCFHFVKNMLECNTQMIPLLISSGTIPSNLALIPFLHTFGSRECHSQENCSACLQTLGCGWCHDTKNMVHGKCVQGEYSHSHLPCEMVLNKTDTAWFYDTCPDIDECLLNIHDCHPEAVCINTNSSYVCECKIGFYGNGKDYCMKTCNHTCKNGVCSGYPNYTCECELGWTGQDCSVDCGCNFHSTCTKGVKICDQCQNMTTGMLCDKCLEGTFRSRGGCKRCMCNGHGDVERGVCDPKTGHCYCTGNTEGFHCEECKKNFVGSPTGGNLCYFKCQPKAIMNSSDIHGFGFMLLDHENYGNECLWIIQPNRDQSVNQHILIRVTIKLFQVSMSNCDNLIYFYNDYVDFSENNVRNNSLIGFLCNNNRFSNASFVSHTGMMAVYYRFRGLNDGFIATLDVIPNETETCKAENRCGSDNQLKCTKNCSNFGTCNESYGTCICSNNRTGSDCSRIKSDQNIVISEIFNSNKLNSNFGDLKNNIPRFGHSLTADKYENLWLFGGYSLYYGPLNDLKNFDFQKYTWNSISFDDSVEKIPKERYFHASEISRNEDRLFIYGGLGLFDYYPKIRTLDDFWTFDLKTHRWNQINLKEKPPSLAGHSFTYCEKFNSDFLFLVGGISSRTGFMRHVWQYDITNEIWVQAGSHGSIPQGIYAHNTAFNSKHLYIYGGYELESNNMEILNNIYMLNIETYHWIKLSESSKTKFNIYNFRSAVATNDYMVIYSPFTRDVSKGHLFVYLFQCRQWIYLTNKHIPEMSKLPHNLYIQAMTINTERNRIYLLGNSVLSLDTKLYEIEFPSDICHLFSAKKYECLQIPGCSFCSVKINGTLDDNYCYSSHKSISDFCVAKEQYHISSSNGKNCRKGFEVNRNCTELDNCATCLMNTNCQWCDTCSGYCIPLKQSCVFRASNSIKSLFNCPRKKCLASNCYQCNLQKGCIWKQNFNMFEIHDCLRISKNIKLQKIDECVEKNILNSLILKNTAADICYENDCSTYINCESCLKVKHCFWSVRLSSCLSYHMQSLYCAGGLCGLSLRTIHDLRSCPIACDVMKKCSDCLKISHCGWCANNELLHEGFCTAGSFGKPIGDSCLAIFTKSPMPVQIQSNFSWNFMTCPPENECLNSHHNCSKKSEVCVDLENGFFCKCAPGYIRRYKGCLPHCKNSCIFGNCIEPNVCQCHFGYTGPSCEFQCNCHGNSNCPGPDQLDVCIKCHNNTSGDQCQYCRPGYIHVHNRRTPCITCNQYCNGHSSTCEGIEDDDELDDFISFEKILSENANYAIQCSNCMNNTAGDQCEACVPGTFRGSRNLREPCSPCYCRGHGDRCDPITGDNCNCKNNTENKLIVSHGTSDYPLWVLQCAKCVDTYYGEPSDGHQCYKQMIPYVPMCFDNKFLDDCDSNRKLLYPGEVSFFNIQPRFITMDLRITIDVTFGALNVYLSTFDLFVVTPNASIGSYNIDIDENIAKLYFGNQFFEKSSIVQQSAADALMNYFTLKRNMSIFIATDLKSRLVITLPKDLINFSYTKFFIILQSVVNFSDPSAGIIYFRQDPNNVDAVIFLSVFLSSLFLGLAIVVLARKVRQAFDLRRNTHNQVIQLRHLARRPYAKIDLKLNKNDVSTNNVMPVAVEPTSDLDAAIFTCILSLPIEEDNYDDSLTDEYVTKVAFGTSLVSVKSNTALKQYLNGCGSN